MKQKKRYMTPSRFMSVEINEEICNGCNRCVDICIMDILAQNPEKGKSPIVAYPEECWFDGFCVEMCPLKNKGAIKLNIPLPMRVSVLRSRQK